MDNKYMVYGGIILLILIGLASIFVYFGNPQGFAGQYYAKATVAKSSAVTSNVKATLVASCTDSDGGIKPDKAGTVTYNRMNYPDACLDDGNVKEYYCNGNIKAYKSMACSPGYACVDGACAKKPCSDSDGGYVLDVYGACICPDGRSVAEQCNSGTNIREYAVVNSVCVQYNVDCPQDMPNCVNGACVASGSSGSVDADSNGMTDEQRCNMFAARDPCVSSQDPFCDWYQETCHYYKEVRSCNRRDPVDCTDQTIVKCQLIVNADGIQQCVPLEGESTSA